MNFISGVKNNILPHIDLKIKFISFYCHVLNILFILHGDIKSC